MSQTTSQLANAKSLYEMSRDGDAFPECGEVGQNEAFQGADLINKKGECARVNICHGNAGFGWVKNTVSRSSIEKESGHANFEHNDPSKNKRPDYFPNTYSVPNPNGAGKNGYLDDNCNFPLGLLLGLLLGLELGLSLGLLLGDALGLSLGAELGETLGA